jgi:membrane associated rhomboid family serine protease
MFPIRNAVPTRYPPVVTWTLIAVNCAVFLFQIGLSPVEEQLFLSQFALIPARYIELFAHGDVNLSLPDIVPFFTMMFLHGGWLHLILNMWTLWLFGPAIEDRLGHGTFLIFYLVCGIAASLTHVIFSLTSAVPALGASGAIAGVFFEVPAAVFAGLWFLMQVMQGTAELLMPSAGGVAWWAHIGGFIAGLVLGAPLRLPERRYRMYQPDEGVLGFNQWGR